MTLIGRPPTTAKWHSPEPHGSKLTLPACRAMSACIFACASPPKTLSQFQTQAPLTQSLTPTTPQFSSTFLHSYFLLNMCSSSQKSLQFSLMFSPNVTLAVVERIIAGNYFIHFFMFFVCFCSQHSNAIFIFL